MNETIALTVGLLSGLLIIAFVFWPAVRIFRRLRLNPAWLALLIIPLALLVLLWFLAYAKWPGNGQGEIMPSGPRSAICGLTPPPLLKGARYYLPRSKSHILVRGVGSTGRCNTPLIDCSDNTFPGRYPLGLQFALA